jgi:hypothetical protein
LSNRSGDSDFSISKSFLSLRATIIPTFQADPRWPSHCRDGGSAQRTGPHLLWLRSKSAWEFFIKQFNKRMRESAVIVTLFKHKTNSTKLYFLTDGVNHHLRVLEIMSEHLFLLSRMLKTTRGRTTECINHCEPSINGRRGERWNKQRAIRGRPYH